MPVRVVGEVAGRVPGDMADLEGHARRLKRLSASEEGRVACVRTQSEPFEEVLRPAEDVELSLGQPHGGVRHLGQLGERAEVVVVAVREQDRDTTGAEPLERPLDLIGLVARIDDHGFGRAGIGAYEVSVGPDLAEGKLVDGEAHGRMSLSLAPVQHWNLMEIQAPSGTRDPVVVHSGNEARAVMILLMPGQRLGDHQVKENAWITVLEGSATVSAGSESVPATPGMLFRFDPD